MAMFTLLWNAVQIAFYIIGMPVNGTITSWTLDSQRLPYNTSRSFAVYDNRMNMIHGIGGDGCTKCSFTYDLTNNIMSKTSENALSNGIRNGDSNNAVLINDTMYVIDYTGKISLYNIDNNNFEYGWQTVYVDYPCMVTNSPYNTHLYVIDGSGKYFSYYSFDTQQWSQGINILKSQERPSCVYMNNYLYIFAGYTKSIVRYYVNNNGINDKETVIWESFMNYNVFSNISRGVGIGINNKLYQFGGKHLYNGDHKEQLNNVYEINIESKTVNILAPLLGGRRHPLAIYATSKNKIYILGGMGANYATKNTIYLSNYLNSSSTHSENNDTNTFMSNLILVLIFIIIILICIVFLSIIIIFKLVLYIQKNVNNNVNSDINNIIAVKNVAIDAVKDHDIEVSCIDLQNDNNIIGNENNVNFKYLRINTNETIDNNGKIFDGINTEYLQKQDSISQIQTEGMKNNH